MKTLTVSQLKSDLGRTIDQVIQGDTCVVVRGNKFAIIQRYDLPDLPTRTTAQETAEILKMGEMLPLETDEDMAKVDKIVKEVRTEKRHKK